jgi:hypothetical protein
MSLRAFVKPKKSLVINSGPRPLVSVGQIVDVEVRSPEDGNSLVYESITNKYVVKEITVTSNNIINVSGGQF